MLIKSSLNKFLSETKNSFKFGTKTIFVLFSALILSLSTGCSKSNDMVAASVMITNVAGNSGGTGVIISSSPTSSKVLTNSHVCRLVEKGGLVSGRAGSFLVATYMSSEAHDLCLITVNADLKANTKLADMPPALFHEKASISGHPNLFPNVITTGHFSGRRVIEVMMGVKACTPEDMNDPNKSFFCLLIGGIPEIKRYESILVTATIMAGSSGSAVYNEKQELAGLVFAGSGDLSYAWTVPYEAVANFLKVEQHVLTPLRPSAYVQLFPDSTGNSKKSKIVDEAESLRKLKKLCSTPKGEKFKDICELVSNDVIWIK